MNPLQLADVLDEFAINPQGGKMAAIAYKKAAHLIREKLVRNNDTDFGQLLAENQLEIERLRDLLRRAASYGGIEPQLDIEIHAAIDR